MSTSNLPRRSPRKNPQQPPLVEQSETQNAQANWKPTHERVLLDILMDLIKDGVDDSFGQHLHKITPNLNSRISLSKISSQKKDHLPQDDVQRVH
jgi:hypothetical protein